MRRGVSCWLVLSVATFSCGNNAKLTSAEPLGGDQNPSTISNCVDYDGDGVPGTGRCLTSPIDCDDSDPTISPTATETCNGRDDNCDKKIDENVVSLTYYVDKDGDSYGDPARILGTGCGTPPQGAVSRAGDCDDNNSNINPGAIEICNGFDDNCDKQNDEGISKSDYYPDADGDTHGNAAAQPISSCVPIQGRVANNSDCDDARFSVHPGAAEACNGLDDNCDGNRDEGMNTNKYFVDLDGDSYGAKGTQGIDSCLALTGYATNDADCNDANSKIHPGVSELCNGADDNCDGDADEGLSTKTYYVDLDGDTYGAQGTQGIASCTTIAGYVQNNTDCNDTSSAIHPNAVEICNRVDDNCSGESDEGLATQTYYVDLDGDSYGAKGTVGMPSCSPVVGRVTNALDCNDSASQIKPGALEVCNNTDDNCSGSADEGDPGGGGACSTGIPGICASGVTHCVSGALACVQNQQPVTEICNQIDDNCSGAADESFPNVGQTCKAGLGVCERSGQFRCSASGTTSECGAVAGAPTANACDSADNNCNGVVDELLVTDAYNISTTNVFDDIEVVPYYYSASGCKGGAQDGLPDTLAGGAALMAVGTPGIHFQRLDTAGIPSGGVSNFAGSYSYVDIAAVPLLDGFLVAGAYRTTATLTGQEIDFYFVDASGVKRTMNYTNFKTGNAIDSVRLVRVNGRRAVIIFREAGVGVRMARVEVVESAGNYTIQNPGGGALSSTLLVASAGVASGIGADSNVFDGLTTMTCGQTGALANVGIAYVSDSGTQVRFFTVKEDGSQKSAENVIRPATTGEVLAEPDVAYFVDSNGAGQYGYAWAMKNAAKGWSDLEFSMTTRASPTFAFSSYAMQNGADSISRPRVGRTSNGLWVAALRYEVDVSAYKKQLMLRRVDFSGLKQPTSLSVEKVITTGSCMASDTLCRPGNKSGLSLWASKSRFYMSANATAPAIATYTGALTCQ